MLVQSKGIIQPIGGLLILLFIYTALSKPIDLQQFEGQPYRSPLVENKAAVVAWSLSLIEFLISLLLLVPKTQHSGLLFSLVLMRIFTLYVTYMKVFVPHLPAPVEELLRVLPGTSICY